MVFVHIFAHKSFAYNFKEGDWMADNFFSGGTMPSQDLFLYFPTYLKIRNQWAVSGTHYERTSNDWLKNMDQNITKVREIFENVYPKNEGNFPAKSLSSNVLFQLLNGLEDGDFSSSLLLNFLGTEMVKSGSFVIIFSRNQNKFQHDLKTQNSL
jgi:hypothetical protein